MGAQTFDSHAIALFCTPCFTYGGSLTAITCSTYLLGAYMEKMRHVRHPSTMQVGCSECTAMLRRSTAL